ncbi:hypothetical protein FKW77_004893 [Venturia effusa]|uniref:Uncharacterized protein n=1 Tax=Venturia effusa TaxID=50376 RepID=A0A517LNU7_9PEZI|nr:hypothetical protein FKW77_004893 [Venturia effusa]
MSSTATAPRNRAERRKAAKDAPFLHEPVSGIPLAQPDRSGPKSKTLFELAAERQAELEASGFYNDEGKRKGGPNGETNAQFLSSDEDDEPIGPLGESLVYTISLAAVHFTLDVLVFNQYRQEIVWSEILRKTLRMIPGLYILLSKTSAGPQATHDVFVDIAADAGPKESVNHANTEKSVESVKLNVSGSLYTGQSSLRFTAKDAIAVDINSSAAPPAFPEMSGFVCIERILRCEFTIFSPLS